MSKMLRNSYEVTSHNGIKGVVNDYGVVIKLNFKYDGKDIEIGLSRPFSFDEKDLKAMGLAAIDSYINILHKEGQKTRKLQLHHWYINEMSYCNKMYRAAHGIVTGHERLSDSTFIHTSEVKEVVIDKDAGEVVIITRNSVYHCPMEYCRWKKQDKTPEFLPEYDWIKENYKGKINYPTIEDDKVLLVLSNFDEYYFNSLYYKPSSAKDSVEYVGSPHVGMFQDSYLISCVDTPIDIRYFPHYQNIEFYSEDSDGKPFFIENIGDTTLFARTSKGLIRLNPGDRKEVLNENAEKEEPFLPGGDLYPAGIVE